MLMLIWVCWYWCWSWMLGGLVFSIRLSVDGIGCWVGPSSSFNPFWRREVLEKKEAEQNEKPGCSMFFGLRCFLFTFPRSITNSGSVVGRYSPLICSMAMEKRLNTQVSSIWPLKPPLSSGFSKPTMFDYPQSYSFVTMILSNWNRLFADDLPAIEDSHFPWLCSVTRV